MNQKSILITGCSSGIGQSAALSLKQRGYRVFATARKDTDVEKLKSLGLESLRLDVDDSSSIRSALTTILQRTGGTLDAVFNNAGYLQAGAVEDITRDMMRAQFETNVFGAMELTRLVLPIMRKQGYGRIIQNSSILGIIPMSYCGVYNASKFALEGFSSSLRHELRGTQIYVSIIAPGPISSKLRDNAHQQYQETLSKEQSGAYADVYKKLEKSYFTPDDRNRKVMQEPDAVIKKLILALESEKPKAHYYIGFPAHVLALLRRILPDSALDWVICKVRS